SPPLCGRPASPPPLVVAHTSPPRPRGGFSASRPSSPTARSVCSEPDPPEGPTARRPGWLHCARPRGSRTANPAHPSPTPPLIRFREGQLERICRDRGRALYRQHPPRPAGRETGLPEDLLAQRAARGRLRGPAELGDTIDQREQGARLGRHPRSNEEIGQLKSDVQELLSLLPQHLRKLADHLRRGRFSDAARELGVPRTSLYAWVWQLRRRFERAGLKDYLDDRPSPRACAG